LAEMFRVARCGVIAGSWHQDLPDSAKPWRYDEGTWVYDFRRIARESFGVEVEVAPYPEGAWEDQRWKRYGAIISARLQGVT
jgi:hypothetical protein